MNNAPMGNEDNMQKVRAAMSSHEQVQLAGDFKEGVPIDFTTLEGNRYTGIVVFKKMNMFDFMKAGARKSELLRVAGVKDLDLVDPDIKFMAHVVAMLEHAAVKRPDWLLQPSEIKEPELLYHVFGKYSEWEYSFRKGVQGDSAVNRQDSTGAQAVDTSEVSVRGNTADGPKNSGNDGRTD